MNEFDPKNSQAREITKDHFYKVAELVHKASPNLTANQLTMGRAVASMIATEGLIQSDNNPALKIASMIGYTAFELADGVDGHLAEIEAREQDRPTNLRGNIYDVLSDKTVETYNSFRIAERSIRNGDKLGAVINILAGVSSPMPALFRAKAEANNVVVKEGGIGTRPIRSTLIGFNVAFGGNRTVSRALGATVLAMNTYTTIRRFNVHERPDSSHALGELNNEKKQNEGKIRYPALLGFTALASVAGGLLIKRAVKSRNNL